MTNVIPFPTKTNPLPDEPLIRRDTASDLIEKGRVPRHGDFVFSVRYRDDDGDLVVTGPGTGFLESGSVENGGKCLCLNWGKGPSILVRGDAVLTWYPTP